MDRRKNNALPPMTADDVKEIKPENPDKPYFLSFIEEFWDSQKAGTVMGRIEVYSPSEQYAIEEIRTDTANVEGYKRLRGKWDWKDVSAEELVEIREEASKL